MDNYDKMRAQYEAMRDREHEKLVADAVAKCKQQFQDRLAAAEAVCEAAETFAGEGVEYHDEQGIFTAPINEHARLEVALGVWRKLSSPQGSAVEQKDSLGSHVTPTTGTAGSEHSRIDGDLSDRGAQKSTGCHDAVAKERMASAQVAERRGARENIALELTEIGLASLDPKKGPPRACFPELRCLSVRQPWASLIESGQKTIELRSWSTKYRGPVLIVSGQSLWRGSGYPPGPFGVALCIVNLADVRPVKDGDQDAACLVPPDGYGFAWVLENPKPVKQVKSRGKLGLYRPDISLLEQLELAE